MKLYLHTWRCVYWHIYVQEISVQNYLNWSGIWRTTCCKHVCFWHQIVPVFLTRGMPGEFTFEQHICSFVWLPRLLWDSTPMSSLNSKSVQRQAELSRSFTWMIDRKKWSQSYTYITLLTVTAPLFLSADPRYEGQLKSLIMKCLHVLMKFGLVVVYWMERCSMLELFVRYQNLSFVLEQHKVCPNHKKMEKNEFCFVMKHPNERGFSSRDIFQDLTRTFRTSATSFAIMKKWVVEFRRGWECSENDSRTA